EAVDRRAAREAVSRPSGRISAHPLDSGLCPYPDVALVMYSKNELLALLDARRAGFTLPQALYTSPATYHFDLEAIFQRSWLQVGLEAEIPNTGDYLTYSVGRTSIVVLRDSTGSINAFFNTCRHRGAQICGNPSGHLVRLACPYHQWSYDLSGRLI